MCKAWRLSLLCFIFDLSYAFRPSKHRSRHQALHNSSMMQISKSRAATGAGNTAKRSKDLFVEDYTHVHIAASSHRSVRKDRRHANTLEDSDPSNDAKPDPITLVIAVAVRVVTEDMTLYLPKGYELLPEAKPMHKGRCKALSSLDTVTGTANIFATETSAKSLASEVLECWILPGGEAQIPHIRLKLNPEVVGLSKWHPSGKQENPNNADWVNLNWFWFSVNVWYPESTVPTNENFFKLVWQRTSNGPGGSEGYGQGFEIIPGFAILGDWHCILGEWESWSGCTVACGSGEMRRVRRIVTKRKASCKAELRLQIMAMHTNDAAPKKEDSFGDCRYLLTDTGKVQVCASDDHVSEATRCNTHRCNEGCKLKFTDGVPAIVHSPCTAECGGGVTVTRHVWEGPHCPALANADSYQLAPCQSQNDCKPKCRWGSNFIAITECSALCGYGTMWALQQVIEKSSDQVCEDKKEKVVCIRQQCSTTGLTIVLPDRQHLPITKQESMVALVFTTIREWDEMEIHAPRGYSFGKSGDPVHIETHDLWADFSAFVLGQSGDGIKETRQLRIAFKKDAQLKPIIRNCQREPQPNDAWCRYTIHVPVRNPACAVKPVENKHIPGIKFCSVETVHNEWEVVLYTSKDTTSALAPERLRSFGAGYKVYPKEVLLKMYSAESSRKAQMSIAQAHDQAVAAETAQTKHLEAGEHALLKSFAARHDGARRLRFCSQNVDCEVGTGTCNLKTMTCV